MKPTVLIALVLAFPVWGAEIPPTTVVRFNTVCANCHEGECSGRLSFQSGMEAARDHLQRYLGPLNERESADLFALLKFTKEQCRHYPLKSNMPTDGHWKSGDLQVWRNPSEGGYFIPLGDLDEGKYLLRLKFAGEPQGRVRISGAGFDTAVDEQLCRGGVPELTFSVSGGEHYLHLQGQAELLGLELQRQR